ncbi:protein adenylyltransferase SelO [Bacillus niameyensis]|uniref:protein adenylyltransferase SelO n=1 Tax=Bacillus niameyensis TaxID=1522308 RepID=UPI0007822B06|nr:YdiU family protein [Bacillus niameyensis]
MTKKSIGWKFDNSYSQLPNNFFTRLNPTPVRSPELAFLNDSLAASLGLDAELMRSNEGVAVFAGNEVPKGASPLAQAYAGHQFGHFTMLGDGRAILLGEHLTPSGERFDIQLKGSGRTPYSRSGDGRAALGPMLREYIISEAMHGLGIPTTRSLAVVKTGESIIRETVLPGAILTRVAASHLRVGTFEYAANSGSVQDLQSLADYAIMRHFPEIEDDENRYLALFKKVMTKQAALIAKWQLVGFIHGVMNTDNMAISGETIDYGPCAFMDEYNPDTVFSSIDIHGRYAYRNQPRIGGWNLARFAEALLPLFHEKQEQAVELAQEMLNDYSKMYMENWLTGMRAKLGIFNAENEDESLIEQLLQLMHDHHADYTNTFRALTFNQMDGTELFNSEEFTKWKQQWEARLDRQQESRADSLELMKTRNPAVIPRNHRVEEALTAAVEINDLSVTKKLLAVLKDPYAHNAQQEEYSTLPEPSCQPYQTFCGT